MFTENGLQADLDAIRDLLERADVLAIGFATFAERVLIDARSSEASGPMIAIVAPVATVQERYAWLGQHRGEFGAPQAFSFFVWPHSVRRFAGDNVIEPMAARLRAVSDQSDDTLRKVMARLVARERQAWRDAVRGSEEWQTVWSRN